MPSYQPIDCDRHDFLEIACMHHYRLRIELVDGQAIEAEAVTTRTAPNKEEFFCVNAAEGMRELRLDRLRAITPLNDGASFGRVLLAS